jgi:hypothetical protein
MVIATFNFQTETLSNVEHQESLPADAKSYERRAGSGVWKRTEIATFYLCVYLQGSGRFDGRCEKGEMRLAAV